MTTKIEQLYVLETHVCIRDGSVCVRFGELRQTGNALYEVFVCIKCSFATEGLRGGPNALGSSPCSSGACDSLPRTTANKRNEKRDRPCGKMFGGGGFEQIVICFC